MDIQTATFVTSSATLEQCPDSNLPEYAFIGRSNVGKSSLINMLTNRRNLAKTSGTPGKTRLINHFLINDHWHLVDLPGYGFAKTSKKEQRNFSRMISAYFQQRRQLISAFVLVDSRHEPQKIDLDFMERMGEQQIPFSIIFTKTDKLKPRALEKNTAHYKTELAKIWDPLPLIFSTSSEKKIGGDAILAYIDSLNQSL